jgi:phospholipid/cholesterol/gamma-HCH transport system substrate-binding protein
MRIRRETKIGVLVLISLALLIWGFEFLKGRNLLSGNPVYFAEYTHVDQLRGSQPVFANGYQVGVVKDVFLKENDLSKIIVEFEIDKGVPIPQGTIAEISTTSMMGGRAVTLKFPEACMDGSCPPSGEQLVGVTQGFLNSMVGTSNVEEYMDILDTRLNEIVDKLLSKLQDNPELTETSENITATIQNLKATTARLNSLLANSSESIEKSLENISSISGNLREQDEKINSVIGNLDSLSAQLVSADLPGTVQGLNTTIGDISQAVNELTGILSEIKSGDGTLGLLISERETYDKLNRTLDNLDLLLQDVRLNPKRYTRILSKKQTPYETPEEDPAFDNN